MGVNIFDIIIAVLLFFGFARGLMRGFFVEVSSLIALIAGVYGAIHFSYFIENYLKTVVSWKEEYVNLVAFAATFISIVLAIALAGKMLTKLADFAALGIVNKVLGGIFGALKIGLILSVLLLFFSKMNDTIPFIDKETLQKAILYEPVKKIAPTIFPSLIKEEKKDTTTG